MGIRRLFLIRLVVVAASVLIASPAQAQTLPAEAQESYERGIEAARLKAWDLAVKYFNEANMKLGKNQDRHPLLLLQLGNAYQQRGDELLAIRHFDLYLASSPTAPHVNGGVTALRRAIVGVETAGEAKARDVLQKITDTVLKHRNEAWRHPWHVAGKFSRDVDTCEILFHVAAAHKWLGDAEKARSTAHLAGCQMPGDYEQRDGLVHGTGRLQIQCAINTVFYTPCSPVNRRPDPSPSPSFLHFLQAYWAEIDDELDLVVRNSVTRETNKKIHEAQFAPLTEIPFHLYGVARPLAYWLPIIRRNRPELRHRWASECKAERTQALGINCVGQY